MKKFILILFALALVLCLISCKESNKTDETPIKVENDNNISIWIDEETGVQYIIYSDYVGGGGGFGICITPRLNADGTLYISAESEDTE